MAGIKREAQRFISNVVCQQKLNEVAITVIIIIFLLLLVIINKNNNNIKIRSLDGRNCLRLCLKIQMLLINLNTIEITHCSILVQTGN